MQRWWLAGWLALLGLGLFGVGQLSAAPPLPWAAFWRLVSTTRAQLAQMDGVDTPTRQTALQTLADDWAAITAVTLPTGEVVPLDLSAWVAALRAPEADPAQLAQTLATWEAARDTFPSNPDAAADLAALFTVLQRPEFQAATATPPPWEAWWADLQRRFWEWLASWFPSGEYRIFIDGPWITGLAVLAAVGLGLLLAAILRGMLGNLGAEATWQDPHATTTRLTAETARQQAQTLAAGGDHRTAVRYLYLSALLSLEERGLLRYDRSLTNREYVRQVRHTPALATELQNVVEVFDRVWYGYQAVDAEVYARYAQSVNTLRQTRSAHE